jgi:hypothetical protein
MLESLVNKPSIVVKSPSMKIPSLLYLERYRNQGTRTYSSHASYTEAGERYRPDAGHDAFELPAFALPRSQVLVYTANPPEALSSFYLGEPQVFFCIHPQVLETLPQDPYIRNVLCASINKKEIIVTPSSSTRTLFVTPTEHPHAIKVHFPFKVSRYTRKMRDEVVEQAINVSRELENEIHLLDERFAFFREVIGVSHKQLGPDSARGENWGYIVRDMVPFPRVSVDRPLVPGFSLYGEDFYEPDKPMLLYHLIGDRDPVTYVLDNIMLPIVRHWAACFLHFGYLIEPHGQNVLFEIEEDGTVGRIVHRDLSVGIDMRRRRDIGKSNSELNQYNRMESGAFHSITYDRFMGTHFFDRIVEACQQKYTGLGKEDFCGPCKEEFEKRLPEHARYFPKTVWYFSEKRDEFNKPLYNDTGVAPQWRP